MFHPPPNDGREDVQRYFTQWKEHILTLLCGQISCWYQGECNAFGQLDGRGLCVVPGSELIIGHFKEGTGHGKLVKIDVSGVF